MKCLIQWGLSVCLIFASVVMSYGQQQAMYTQYMFNGLAINPAYAGSQETLSLTALGREQWMGLEGAPSSQTFSAHAPLNNRKIALGLLLTHDEIGVTNQYGAYAIYAYRIKFSKGTLSTGLQAGFNSYRANFSQVFVPQDGDGSFTSDDLRSFLPNFGAGAYYSNSRFYAGFSLPLLLTNAYPGEEGSLAKQYRHWFLSSGYVFDLSSQLKLKPNLLIKAVEGAPLEVDINANLLIKELVWVGVSYRSLDALSFLLEFEVTPQFRFGYAYDHALTEMQTVQNGTHELMLNYRFMKKDKKMLTPRYF
ncbi:PorP/SprF family type IX secretion system membrane protein [Catalinimonas niigatensis]|uniref:PorP/SprF family type IX secretion system membrane protein n=1 Tax=Catalinimonas niigatensis TaxID=1397264 RepID=UPI002664FC58|nr:type IX secretion system membrane protein PorP/SprF [Catalinimonas niigatensis]WPP49753.1 type IX secretion system membrane protein PorP/SprF [Catalinimonas niigatensis]